MEDAQIFHLHLQNVEYNKIVISTKNIITIISGCQEKSLLKKILYDKLILSYIIKIIIWI